jgi:hypothetical protein
MNDSPTLADRVFPLNPTSPHADLFRENETFARFFLFDLRGVDAEKIATLLATIKAEMADQMVIPIFVTDLLEFKIFRDAKVIFEALPPIAASAAIDPSRDWAARQEDVMLQIRKKWQPSGETQLGMDASC